MMKSMSYTCIFQFWVIPHLRGIQAMKFISRKSETEEETCCELLWQTEDKTLQRGRTLYMYSKTYDCWLLCTGTKQ